ncbi:IQ domain-containing protein E-like isoform X2 [Acanthaster planci]|uniref:IQ domain-containing protein E-like isoform X2 n=1 Tax=Acanthaster planci TaxID=133434 RepID=A0A8B7ZVJ8_ACAPL|nr:IQ domain-containing protein E-like isoform X2 [Acanthaster planci]
MPTIEDVDLEESFYTEDSFSDLSEEELWVESRESGVSPLSVRPKSAPRGTPRKAGSKKPQSPYQQRPSSSKHRGKHLTVSCSGTQQSSRELWLQSLRLGTGNLTGSGRSSNYAGQAGTTKAGLDSCSDYLKETVLGMTSRRHQRGNTMEEPLNRNSKGVPNYKPQEDMYDDILELKKQNNILRAESERVKARNRRLEDEHLKKERTIEQLLDPSKGDVRMTLTSKQPDTAAVSTEKTVPKITVLKMNSLKQKVVKLEMVLKDREAELSNLKSDLKTTKIDEMRVGMEAFYQEVQRLRYLQSQGLRENGRSPSRTSIAEKEPSGTAKLKALNATILRLTESNQRLQSENKLLKQDLERALDEAMSDMGDTPRAKKRRDRKRDYEDMNRKELLTAIVDLEDNVAKLEGKTASTSTRPSDIPEKIELTGTLADRLDQLDKRETELLEQKTKLERDCKRLKEDKANLRQRVDEMEDEVQILKKELSEVTARDNDRRRSLQRHPSSEAVRRSSSARSLKQQQQEEEWLKERDRKVEEFRKNRSARNIQKNWKMHHKKALEEQEVDDAAVMIQSAMRGHMSRKEHMKQQDANSRRNDWSVYSDEEDDSEMDEAALTIQSAIRGHMSRRDYMKKTSEDNSLSGKEGRKSSRSHSGSQHSRNNGNTSSRAGSEIEEDIVDSDDDSIVVGGSTANLRMPTNQGSRPTSARKDRESPVMARGSHTTPRSSRAGSRSSTPRIARSVTDDDDDFVMGGK